MCVRVCVSVCVCVCVCVQGRIQDISKGGRGGEMLQIIT